MFNHKDILNAIAFFMFFAIAGNALTNMYEFAQNQSLANSPHTEFFNYLDLETEETYFVGEPIKITSVRTATGDYKATYTDKIFCPKEPRTLEMVAVSFGSVSNTNGEIERSTWTYGSFIPGEPFAPNTIDEPRENCVPESTIKITVNGVEKTQTITGKNTFNIIERQENE